MHAWRYHVTQGECSSRLGCIACLLPGPAFGAQQPASDAAAAQDAGIYRYASGSWGGAAGLDAAAAALIVTVSAIMCIHTHGASPSRALRSPWDTGDTGSGTPLGRVTYIVDMVKLLTESL